jgi:hypothetical protein
LESHSGSGITFYNKKYKIKNKLKLKQVEKSRKEEMEGGDRIYL